VGGPFQDGGAKSASSAGWGNAGCHKAEGIKPAASKAKKSAAKGVSIDMMAAH
jgi:hypothetical protein